MHLMRTRPRVSFPSLVLVLALPAAAAPPAEKVTGPEACAECHVEEIEAWKLTKHFKTLNELHRRPETGAMLAKLGLGRIKSEQQCLECHYLGKREEGAFQVVSGIACESCHGAARDWVQGHGDYGKGVTKATEAAGHRTARLTRALADGMISRDNIYQLGASCYSCHLLTDEKLTNTGGHVPGSPGFNLLTWSQGEVRHTILHTGNKANPEATPEQKRRLFVLGCILETEFCFRAVGHATEKAEFGVTLARRADAARKLLEKIQALAPNPELAAIVTVARGAGLRLNNATELNAAADRISGLAREFAARVTGEQLVAIDSLLPGPERYQGKPYQVAGAP